MVHWYVRGTWSLRVLDQSTVDFTFIYHFTNTVEECVRAWNEKVTQPTEMLAPKLVVCIRQTTTYDPPIDIIDYVYVVYNIYDPPKYASSV